MAASGIGIDSSPLCQSFCYTFQALKCDSRYVFPTNVSRRAGDLPSQLPAPLALINILIKKGYPHHDRPQLPSPPNASNSDQLGRRRATPLTQRLIVTTPIHSRRRVNDPARPDIAPAVAHLHASYT